MAAHTRLTRMERAYYTALEQLNYGPSLTIQAYVNALKQQIHESKRVIIVAQDILSGKDE